jgi:thymidylate synthase (FAD)
MVRSKHLDFLQRSQRYCKESKESVVYPIIQDQSAELLYEEHIEKSFEIYEALIDCGMKKEDARMILPQCTTTELIVTGNFQSYKDLIKLRKNKESQWEIRDVVVEIEKLLREIAPSIF